MTKIRLDRPRWGVFGDHRVSEAEESSQQKFRPPKPSHQKGVVRNAG
jgi:hypothetical protein